MLVCPITELITKFGVTFPDTTAVAAGATVGTCAGLGLLSLVLFFLIKHCIRKRAEKDQVMPINTNQNNVNNISDSKASMDHTPQEVVSVPPQGHQLKLDRLSTQN